jgi:hypothetical protein
MKLLAKTKVIIYFFKINKLANTVNDTETGGAAKSFEDINKF